MALEMTISEQIEFPCALGIKLPCDKEMIFTHYRDKATADFFASLADTDGNEVKRYVLNIITNRYMEVAYFLL